MKKAAICLRGCVDRIKSGCYANNNNFIYDNNKEYIKLEPIYNSIKIHILENNKDFEFDFFLHCWNLEKKEEIIQLYQPKDFCFEDQRNFNFNFPNEYQCYSICKSLELMNNYSKKNNIKYDKIISYRPDVLLYKDINLKLYEEEKLYANNDKYGDFHFIMSQKNSFKFQEIINSNIKYKKNATGYHLYSLEKIKNPLIGDEIKFGIHQEVLRKLKFSSIDRSGVKKETFYKYGLTDNYINLLTHI